VERLHPRVEGHVVSLLNRYGFGYLIGNHLQDIVNYVWRDVMENMNRFEKGDFELWSAYRRVKRVLDYLRKEVKHIPVDPDRDPRGERPAAPSNNPERQLLFRQLQERIEELPTHYALVLKLYYWEGLSYREIADFLGKSHNSIGSLHTRALRKLKVSLDSS